MPCAHRAIEGNRLRDLSGIMWAVENGRGNTTTDRITVNRNLDGGDLGFWVTEGDSDHNR